MRLSPYAAGWVDALALVAIVVILMAAALLSAGCGPTPTDEPPELASDCPGGLLCECSRDEECDGFGVDDLLVRGMCRMGLCTVSCVDDDVCTDALPDAGCDAAGPDAPALCGVQCDDDCDELGLPDAQCLPLAGDPEGTRICGGAP